MMVEILHTHRLSRLLLRLETQADLLENEETLMLCICNLLGDIVLQILHSEVQ